MGGLLGNFLPLAVGIAISPVPIIAVIMMLTSKGALRNAAFFTAGWVLAMVVTCTASILLFGDAATSVQKGMGTATEIMQCTFGVLLLVMGTLRFRQKRKGVKPKQPKLLQSIENIKPAGAIGFGLAMIIINPKNLMLLLTALMQVGKSHPSTGQAVASVVIFILVASLGVLTPLFVYVVFRKKATAILTSWNEWLAVHSSTVTMYLFLALGVFLLVKGVVGLTS